MTLGRGVEPPFAGLLPNMKAADPFYWTKASSFGFTWQSSPYLAQPWSWANQNVGPSNSMSLSQVSFVPPRPPDHPVPNRPQNALEGSNQTTGASSSVVTQEHQAQPLQGDLPSCQSFRRQRRNAVATLPPVVETGILYLLASASTCSMGICSSGMDGQGSACVCASQEPLPQVPEYSLYAALGAWKFDTSGLKAEKRGSDASMVDLASVRTKRRKSIKGPLTEVEHSLDEQGNAMKQDSGQRKAASNERKVSCPFSGSESFIRPTMDDIQFGRNRTRISSGKTYTITEKIELRQRRRSGALIEEVGVIPYPQYPPQFAAAARNSGPLASNVPHGKVEATRCEFGSDLYTPRFIRRSCQGEVGSYRMGFCSLCSASELEGESGGWYSPKRSQYLYHLQFEHGISSISRRPFSPPVEMRIWNDDDEATDGLCGVCGQWVAIAFGPVRRRSWKAWWKHAAKSHRSQATGRPI